MRICRHLLLYVPVCALYALAQLPLFVANVLVQFLKRFNGRIALFVDIDNTKRRSTSSSAGRYDYSPRPASRFDDASQSFADEAPQTQPRSSRNTGASRQKTVMFALHNLEDCCDVIDNLIMNNTVVLTMDNLDDRLMQRAVDTLSGAVFALHATIRKASERTYLIAPMTVEVNETYDTDDRFF